MRQLLFLFFLSNSILSAQSINWKDISGDYNLPGSVKLYQGEINSPILKLWYFDVDLSDTSIAVRSYIHPAGKDGITNFNQTVGAIASINGGFFDINGNTSYSAVIYPEEVKAQNISSVNRTAGTYYPTRSLFSLDNNRNPSINWIYHFSNEVSGIYSYANPTLNTESNPAPKPEINNGIQMDNILTGIGGGPTLVKNSISNVTYEEEVFFGSGVGLSNPDPRTAVGYTNEYHIIMLVADGRSALSQGVSLTELSQIMIELGCVEAMNLDGGGSSQMAIGSTLINKPEGADYQRQIPSVLSIVYADSLKKPVETTFEKTIDSEDIDFSLVGSGWFTSANSGFWGGTEAWLNEVGTGESYAEIHPKFPAKAEYEVYAWWVAASNRRNDTPFIISHSFGMDTVYVDQQKNGSSWQLIGKYNFAGTASDAIYISDFAGSGNGNYIVADAIKIISYDPNILVALHEKSNVIIHDYKLFQNYPNPFNPATIIEFQIPNALRNNSKEVHIELIVYDALGQVVCKLLNEYKSPGKYKVNFKAEELSSGIYFYKLKAGTFSTVKKMILLH